MTRRLSWSPPRIHSYRILGAVVLLVAQLLMMTATPVALGVAATMDADVDAMVCNCIHDPGATCPMHGGGSSRSRPGPGSGPHWSPCGGTNDAGVIALATTIGIPVATRQVAPPVWSLGRIDTALSFQLESSSLPGVPPPRA
jgi:hypothetical protein